MSQRRRWKSSSAVIAYQLALNMLLGAADGLGGRRRAGQRERVCWAGCLRRGRRRERSPGSSSRFPLLTTELSQLALICLLVLSLAGPLLALGAAERRAAVPRRPCTGFTLYFDFGLLWFARLLVQVAGAVLFTFLLYFFQSRAAPASQFQVALLAAATLLAGLPADAGARPAVRPHRAAQAVPGRRRRRRRRRAADHGLAAAYGAGDDRLCDLRLRNRELPGAAFGLFDAAACPRAPATAATSACST